LARFYAALPALSRSLSATFFSSPWFIASIRRYPREILIAAAELRHSVLFREALIFILNPWENPEYLRLEDPKLKKVAHIAYNALGAKVAKAHGETFITLRKSLTWADRFHEITESSKLASTF
jgi:hypothetical protein